MAENQEKEPNNIVSAPKNVTEMKDIIRPALVRNPELAERMTALTGFPIRWQRLNLAEAAMVWLAWRAMQGSGEAAHMLAVMRGVEVEEREHVTAEEINALRQIAEQFRELEQTIYIAHSPHTAYVGPKAALLDIITERNVALDAMRPQPQEE